MEKLSVKRVKLEEKYHMNKSCTSESLFGSKEQRDINENSDMKT